METQLRYLRDRHLDRLTVHPRVRCYTSRDPPQSCAIATIGIEGTDSANLSAALWQHHRIVVTTIKHEQVDGIRVSSNVYTTLPEIDMVCDAIEGFLRDGLRG